jgi:hypothetical protein
MTALRNANPDVVREDGPDPSKGRWSQIEMLLASLVDDVRFLRHDYRVANGTTRAKAPDPIRRPGVVDKSSKNKLSDDQYDWLYRHINGLDHPDGGGFIEVSIDMKPLEAPTARPT